MSILVCGGAGYIGSHTVYKLIEQGKDVVIVDNLQRISLIRCLTDHTNFYYCRC